MCEPVIRVEALSKEFQLPHLRQRTLKSRSVHLFRKSRVVEVQHALQDVDFSVTSGEFFGVCGRNGSGKSTLLKILAGIYPPSSGSATSRGRLVPFIELGVGFNPELTGRENVYLNGALLGFSSAEIDGIYDDIVSFAELDDFMDQKLKFYSSGMQVRIAFSVATRANADILLIDEVLAVGDAAFQRKCFEHFHALKKKGTTIVFVTHDMGAVREFCDRAILIEDGRIASTGSADHVATEYMRLFNPWAPTSPTKKSEQIPENRWGVGGVRHTHVRVPEYIADQDEVVIEAEATAERDIAEAVYGFRISDSSGTALLGTNSFLKHQPCGGLQRGEHVRVQWRVPNVLSDGRHYVDLAIHDYSGTTIYEYWKDAASFMVVKDEKTPYMLTPDTQFSFERLEGQPPGDLTPSPLQDR